MGKRHLKTFRNGKVLLELFQLETSFFPSFFLFVALLNNPFLFSSRAGFQADGKTEPFMPLFFFHTPPRWSVFLFPHTRSRSNARAV
jgi:hypothetical protein